MSEWTAPAVDRPMTPTTGDERTLLEGWLDWHRQTLLLKCAGLTGKQLKEAASPPSSLTLLGLVRHLTDVERQWFRRGALGEDAPPLYYAEDNNDGEFDDVADADAEADFAVFRSELDTVRTAAASLPLDREFTGPHGFTFSVRWVHLHMIEEYARHNGHADLLRERIDGVTGT